MNYLTKSQQMLTITIDTDSHDWVNGLDPSLHPLSLCLAGKTILEYLLQWARHKHYSTITINDIHPNITHEKVHEFSELYGVEIIYAHLKKEKEKSCTADAVGVGIFNDDGSYYPITSSKVLFDLEEKLMATPLAYSTSIGYQNDKNIQIGENVYIHRSVKLKAPLIIGDNCILEPNVKIEDSIINPNVHIGKDTIIKHSHIEKNLHISDNLYIDNKALFALKIYDKKQHKSFAHDGVCYMNKEH